MPTQLVLIHGRSQQEKDAGALKAEWLAALNEGLAKRGLTLPIPVEQVRFPYFGDTLYALANGLGNPPAVTVRRATRRAMSATPPQSDEDCFVNAVAEEVIHCITTSSERPSAALLSAERGFDDQSWAKTPLQQLDRLLPAVSRAMLELVTRDVYRYLNNSGIRCPIERGVSQAITPGVSTVVIAHSLGSVVAYNLLQREGHLRGWKIPLLITVGSPLAITAIRSALKFLAPLRCPQCVEAWYNILDERDFVALHSLDPHNFPLAPTLPAIENNNRIENGTPGHHGIGGYLNDAEVARRIYEALC